ncbi:Cytochrome P450 [Mycena venus]|uniref:Cytochrome P450 n=1 Tax=Mycena venus TaxID=2733690 RepID=A0A8H6YWL7_9AGAR|nr:Cytochrome P450 [Mycena venus]
MLSLDTPSTVAICTILIILPTLYAVHLRSRRPKLPLPPGPPKLPLVGNLFDVPSTFQWKSYAQWSKQYDSDIIHLNMAGTSVIVLSSYEAIDTLFEKRSPLYSDRNDFPMVNELMGWHFNIGLMKYGDEWRTHRRLINGGFNAKAAQKYEPTELVATHGVLARLLHAPEDFMAHFRHMAGEIIMSVAYGIDVLPSDDPYVTLAHEAMRTFSIGIIPGVYLVDTFPLLKHIPRWFPGAGFKRQAEEWSKLARGMLEVPFAETKRQMDAGIAPPSFTTDNLQALDDPNNEPYYQEHHVKQAAAALYVGGADTSVSVLGTFVLAMLAYPEVQKKAQAEIDSLTAGKYLPTFEDKASLSYIAALVKEVLRWENVAPLGGFIVVPNPVVKSDGFLPALPRLLGEDDEYRGYRLPAGSIVVGNTWQILHDERVYPDPHTFKPERFLLDGKLNPAMRDLEIAFGFGRRRCPGRPMALSGIWITVVSILATFDITKAVDEKGNVIEPAYEYIPGGIPLEAYLCVAPIMSPNYSFSTPAPFKCSITPRSQETVALIQGAAKRD